MTPAAARTVVASNCRFCGYLCGVSAVVEGGRVVDVQPDPERYPYDAGVQRGCPRWRELLTFLDHPDRVDHPLRRVGERGADRWERVTWDEALDDIARRLAALRDEYGAETLASSIGGPHATYWPLHRFLSLFGSPNNMGIGQICWNPGVWMQTITYGWPLENEFDPDTTGCVLVWGANFAESDNSLLWRSLGAYARTGRPLVVVDPRRTRTARRATHWLGLRPGTDADLALGLLHVVIAEERYDRAFVADWCHGFAELRAHVRAFAAEVVAERTGVPADTIRTVARLYADAAPAALVTGRGIDQLGRGTAPAHRALAILRAITGNVDVPGASHLGEMPDFVAEVDLELGDQLPEAQRRKALSADLLLQSPAGYDRVRRETLRHGRRLPQRYLTSVHPGRVWEAILTGRPYPVRAMVVMGSNPLLTQADAARTRRALAALDLLVALEYFRTPTARYADYVLPAAGPLERALFQTHAGIANIAYGGAAAVAPYHERRPDYDVWRELGLRLGQEGWWSWPTLEDALADVLAPAGVTWAEFCETGLYHRPSPYAKHTETDPATGRPVGFATPSGKVELWSSVLAELGAEPLPAPPPPGEADGFGLLLLTGARRQPFYASSYRQFDRLRADDPRPLAELSPDTASRLGLADGDEIVVETEHGAATFTLRLAGQRPDVVSVDYGWWFPELAGTADDPGAALRANANVLTAAELDTSEPAIGTWTYNGLRCRVRPAPPDDDPGGTR